MVWDGLEVVWGGLEVVWGGLRCFGVVWGVSTDRAQTMFHTHFGEISSTILSCLRDMKNFIHVRLRLCKTNSHENIHGKYCKNA